jgi:hypothetical protein
MIVNYNHETFIVKATGVNVIKHLIFLADAAVK